MRTKGRVRNGTGTVADYLHLRNSLSKTTPQTPQTPQRKEWRAAIRPRDLAESRLFTASTPARTASPEGKLVQSVFTKPQAYALHLC
jgi:hypothetical protein